MKTTATNQLAISARPTTQKMPPAYSPEIERAKPTGMKPATVTRVPVSMGKAVEVQAKLAARTRSQPSSIFTTIISTAMIASSTSRPRAMISAPREMRSSAQPRACMTMATRPSTSGTEAATTMPVRQPRKTKLTASTMARASRKARSNSQTEASTTCGWSAYFSSVTPAGSSCCSVSSRASSARPSARMLPSRTMVTPIASTGSPLRRMLKLAGSSVPWRTVARASSRRVRGPSGPRTSMGRAATSAASRSAPPTRTKMRSGPCSAAPAGARAFCRASASRMGCGVRPSAASLRVENSTKTFSACRPRMSTLATPGTARRRRLISSAKRPCSGRLSSGARTATSIA